MFISDVNIRIHLLFSLIFASSVLGNAQTQFGLSPSKPGQASACFMTCHSRAIAMIELPGFEAEKDPNARNSLYAFGPNCKLEQYSTIISQCLPVICQSPPDVAYAIESGQSICHRAGGTLNVTLSETYLNSQDGQYFKSELYLASKSSSPMVATASFTALSLGLTLALAAFLL